MYSQDDLVRLKSIKSKIETIYNIVDRHGGVNLAIIENDLRENMPNILDKITEILES